MDTPGKGVFPPCRAGFGVEEGIAQAPEIVLLIGGFRQLDGAVPVVTDRCIQP